jgi:hypothetical protein
MGGYGEDMSSEQQIDGGLEGVNGRRWGDQNASAFYIYQADGQLKVM